MTIHNIPKQIQIIGFFDIDGVIIDHTANKIELAKKYGYNLKPAQTNSNIMEKLIPRKTYRIIQKSTYGKISLSSKQIKNAKETIKKIAKLYPQIYLVSRRRHNNRKFTLQWMKNNKFFPLLNPKNIFFVDADSDKNLICKKLGINVYLDDKIKVLNKLFSVKYKVLFDPYGHHYKNPPKGIKVVKTWPEFYNYLQKLGK